MNASTQASQPDFAMIKERQKQVWGSGNYHVVGARIIFVSEQLCRSVDPLPGMKVLDIASGNGNTALAASRLFCDVTATDFVPDLLEFGRRRAEAEALDVTFEPADAENLPYPDASFDVVLSTMGIMFTPNQERAASEMLRVCRPGGKLGLTAWTPDSFSGRLAPLIGKYLPPPPGVRPPVRWGTEEGLNELLGDGVASMQVERRTQTVAFLSMDHFFTFFVSNFGPMKSTRDALDPEKWDLLAGDIREMMDDLNHSGNETVVMHIPYLEVVAIRA